MPYGYVPFSPAPRPFSWVMLPGECRLSPRHPGYVMTVCDETREKRLERHAATVR